MNRPVSQPDPVDRHYPPLTDFIVARDDTGLLGLGQSNREGVAEGDGMCRLDLGGGQNAILVWKHQPNRKRRQSVQKFLRTLGTVPFGDYVVDLADVHLAHDELEMPSVG